MTALNPPVFLSPGEAIQLRRFIVTSRGKPYADPAMLEQLSAEVERAGRLGPEEAHEAVAMHSRITLFFADSGEAETYTLAYPDEASLEERRISILAPLGIALLGARPGDDITWKTHAGLMRARIIKITNPN